jgi:CBS domain-containing protein
VNGPIKHKLVLDLMTTPVLSIGAETPFKDIVALIREHSVSAVPVIDGEARVLGVVSEADLLLKEERPELEAHRFIEGRGRRSERGKASALAAGELMTAPAITISPRATAAAAATLMHNRKVKRLPVVDDEGRLIGIVSRTDLLKVFLRDDEEIRQEVIHDLALKTLWLEPSRIEVSVRSGVVTLAGEVSRLSDSRLLAKLTQELDGVVGVVNKLIYAIDDTKPTPVREPVGPIAGGHSYV